jgi:choline dehydrogenase-like flavoprotein
MAHGVGVLPAERAPQESDRCCLCTRAQGRARGRLRRNDRDGRRGVLRGQKLRHQGGEGGHSLDRVRKDPRFQQALTKATDSFLIGSGLKTPQILELSGIGNRTLLEKLNIPVKIDIPTVGENVQGKAVPAACCAIC